MTAIKEGSNHASPNAGYPEAAFAGALAVKLNGPSVYQGRLVAKPYIGKAFGDAQPVHAGMACDLMVTASLIWIGMLALASALIIPN